MQDDIRKRKLELMSFIVLAGFIVAAIYHYVLANFFKLGYPHNTFLFLPADSFNDFFNMIGDGGAYLSWQPIPIRIYFPFFYTIAQAFYFIKPLTISLILFLGGSVGFFCVYLWRNIRSSVRLDNMRYMLFFTLFSFPFLFSVDRSNFEILVFVLLALCVAFYFSKRTMLSVVCLAVAISLKIFPAVFLLLFIADKKYKEVLYVIGIAVGLTVFGLLVQPGGFIPNLNRFLINLGLYTKSYALGVSGLDFGNSFFGLIRTIALQINAKVNFASFSTPYMIVVLPMFLFTCWYVVAKEKEAWKRVALLTIAMCFFPLVSAGYKLLHFYIPILLFVNSKDALSRKEITIYSVLWGLLLIPKNYRIMAKLYGGNIIDPLLMAGLAFLIFRSGLKNRAFSNEGTIKQFIAAHWGALKEQCFTTKKRFLQTSLLAALPLLFFAFSVVGISSFRKKADDVIYKLNLSKKKLPELKFQRYLVDRTMFKKVDIKKAVFINSIFKQSDFTKAKLRKSKWQGAHLISTALTDAKLQDSQWDNAVFRNSQLGGAMFNRADMRGVKFYGCDLSFADFTEADLSGALFVKTSFEDVVLTDTDLANAQIPIQWKTLIEKSKAKNIKTIKWVK